MTEDPFLLLGLAARPDLTDDDVRAAWRRIAAATHPDRDDGGDPERFAAAAAAYTTLRTRFGRGDAYADLIAARGVGRGTGGQGRSAAGRGRSGAGMLGAVAVPAAGTGSAVPAGMGTGRPSAHELARRLAGVVLRIRAGRPAVLALRVGIAAVISLGAVAVVGSQPATPGVIVGVVIWLLRTGRHDLAPPPPRQR